MVLPWRGPGRDSRHTSRPCARRRGLLGRHAAYAGTVEPSLVCSPSGGGLVPDPGERSRLARKKEARGAAQRRAKGKGMSEDQYYEFQAIDRPLTAEEMGELRSFSTRARITPTSFVND